MKEETSSDSKEYSYSKYEYMSINGKAVFEAAEKGDLKKLKELHFQGTSVTIMDDEECSILHVAAEEGHIDIIKWIVDEKLINIDKKALGGYTPLYMAAEYEQIDALKLLVELGGDDERPDNIGYTPLMRLKDSSKELHDEYISWKEKRQNIQSTQAALASDSNVETMSEEEIENRSVSSNIEGHDRDSDEHDSSPEKKYQKSDVIGALSPSNKYRSQIKAPEQNSPLSSSIIANIKPKSGCTR